MTTDRHRLDRVQRQYVAELADVGAIRTGAEEIVDWLLAECRIDAKPANLTRAVCELCSLGVFRRPLPGDDPGRPLP